MAGLVVRYSVRSVADQEPDENLEFFCHCTKSDLARRP